MTVKELYKKYNGYDIVLFGRPLKKKTIPFAFLPINQKELYSMVVKDYKVKEKPFDCTVFDFEDLKHKRIEHYKGSVYAYCVKGEN